MKKRLTRSLGLAALVALAILVARPVLLDAAGIPYGVPGSPALELLRADGSAHCEMLSDCHTISVANVGLNLVAGYLLPALIATLFVLGLRGPQRLRSWAAPAIDPPPILARV